MILYLDSSALVKRYITEVGTQQVNAWIDQADARATCLLSRAEVAAAIACGRRLNYISEDAATQALDLFRREWEELRRLAVTEATVARADALTGAHSLRGYDAVHLASVLLWQEAFGLAVTLATFDRELSAAASREGLRVLP